MDRFGRLDSVVNGAGVYIGKAFLDVGFTFADRDLLPVHLGVMLKSEADGWHGWYMLLLPGVSCGICGVS